MTTIQMTLEEGLLEEVDRTVKKLRTTRSALIRDSIRQYLKTLHVRQLEAQHRAGYAKCPVAPITRTIRDIPSEVLLTPKDGMPSDCAINLDHVQTVSKRKLGGLIATLDEGKMTTIRRALLFALGF